MTNMVIMTDMLHSVELSGPSSPARSQFTQKLPAFSPDLAKNMQNYLYFEA